MIQTKCSKNVGITQQPTGCCYQSGVVTNRVLLPTGCWKILASEDMDRPLFTDINNSIHNSLYNNLHNSLYNRLGHKIKNPKFDQNMLRIE